MYMLKLANLIGKTITLTNRFLMVFGYPLFKTHPKNRNVAYTCIYIQLFLHGFPISPRFGFPFWLRSEDNNWPIHTSAQSMREDVGGLAQGCG